MSINTSKRKLPSKKKIFATIVLLSAIFLAININTNPLRKPVETIEANLLQDIPIGTPLEEVRLHFIKDESVSATERHGIVNLGDGKYWQTGELTWHNNDKEINSHKEVGGSLYRVGLGDYQGFPWLNMVTAILVFGPDKKLKYIEVQKWQDAL